MFLNQNIQEMLLLTKPILKINTPHRIVGVAIRLFTSPIAAAFLRDLLICPSFHSPYFHFLLSFPTGKACYRSLYRLSRSV